MKITVKQLAMQMKNGVKALYEEKCGCCHWWLLEDDKHRRWSIVIGWSDGFDKNEEGYFSDGTWQICSKIAYEDEFNAMQTDFDWDFTMPFDENGEVYDTCESIPKDVDWLELAKRLLKEFKEVTDLFAYFETDEEEVA